MSGSNTPYTIPKWPNQCQNAANVYKGCSRLNGAWTSTPQSLMPATIANHENAVYDTDIKLRSLFDSEWGGTDKKYSMVDFCYYVDENCTQLSAFPDITTAGNEWHNHQIVWMGGRPTPPPSSLVNSVHDTYHPSGFWVNEWDKSPNSIVTNDTTITRTHRRRTYTCTFYDLYKGDTDKQIPITRTATLRDGTPATINPPTIDHSDVAGYQGIGWTRSSSMLPETSGEVYDISYFQNVTASEAFYYHYVAINYDVELRYFNGSSTAETTSYRTVGRYSTITDIPSGDYSNRTGYDFGGWMDLTNNTKISTLSSYKITHDQILKAQYNQKKYVIQFCDGWDGIGFHRVIVGHGESVPLSEFPSSYGKASDEGPDVSVLYYGWQNLADTVNVTANANVSSAYYYGTIGGEGKMGFIPSYDDKVPFYGTLYGTVPQSVSVTSRSLANPSTSNFVVDGNNFSFTFNKGDNYDMGLYDATFIVSDTNGNKFKFSEGMYMNHNIMILTLNNFEWQKNDGVEGRYDAQQHPYEPMPNPDPTKYFGVYQSCSNWHVPDSRAVMRLSYSGYDRFSIYLKHCGIANEDYVYVGKPNRTLSAGHSEDDVLSSILYPTASSETGIDSYTKIELSNINPFDGMDFVDIVYKKDSGLDGETDRAYLLIDGKDYTILDKNYSHIHVDNGSEEQPETEESEEKIEEE